jgi:hypothetical protein
MSEPIVLVVRRGALRRYDALKRKASDLQQVEVIWDRREQSRRRAASAPEAERRVADRRQPSSFTWKTADFVVAVPSRRGE